MHNFDSTNNAGCDGNDTSGYDHDFNNIQILKSLYFNHLLIVTETT